MDTQEQLVGFKVEKPEVKLEGENLLGSVEANHVGKIGFVKVKVDAGFQFLPLVNKAVDKLEELIPGDQKAIAGMIKAAISQIKIKF